MRYGILVMGLALATSTSPLVAQRGSESTVCVDSGADFCYEARSANKSKWAKLTGWSGLWAKIGNGRVASSSTLASVELPPVTLQVRYADEGELLRIYGALLDQTYAIDSVAGARMTSEAKQIFRDLRERQPKATVEAWMLALQPAIDDALDARTKWMTRALSPVVRAAVIAKMEALTAEAYDAKYPAVLATLYRAWSADPQAPAGSADSAVLATLASATP